MIFVTVGTLHFAFDRLLREIDGLPGDEEIVVQCPAVGLQPTRAQCVHDLPYEELVDNMRRARIVVSHAGVGSVLTALANDKRPVVVPRLRRHREAVDDHQLEFARHLVGAGLVTLVEDPAGLADALAAVDAAPPPDVGGVNRLALDLRETLEQLVAYSR